MKVKKVLLSVVPLLLIIYSLQSLFVNIEPCLNASEELSEVMFFDKSVEARLSASCNKVYFSKGFIPQIKTLNFVHTELNNSEIPTDGKLSNTTDRLERALLGLKIFSFVSLFLILVSISSIVVITLNVWFGLYLSITSYILSFPYTLKNIGGSVLVLRLGSYPLGLVMLLFHLFVFGLTVWSLFKIFSIFKDEKVNTYKKLYNSSYSEDDSSNVYDSSKNTTMKSLVDTLKVGFHFIVIVVTGIILGNLIYVPLFSLQKHYFSEFGILLIGTFLLMTVFYMYNYYKIGQDPSKHFFTNVLVSFSFFNYRVVRNVFMGFVSLVAVIVFVVFLFMVLFMNTYFLKSLKIIEESINL